MNVGDMVRIVVESDHWGELGLILRTNSLSKKTTPRMIVLWNSGSKCSYPAYQLEVISESR